ncbi:hypothetical protein PG653_10195 [Riemerella anatipestifer]|nr:hypothetical protein [Riemerella anatipestifer]
MKQKLTILGLSGLLLLAGCRADDMVTNAKRQEDLAKKFSVFTKKTDNEVIDYPSGFARLALRYDSLHNKNISGRRTLERLRVLSKKNEVAPTAVEAEAYIDFNIRSQTIVEKNGDRWVVFPRIKGGKVAELVAGVLSEDETKVHFYSLKPDTDIYKTNAHLFEEKYRDRYVFKVNKNNLFELLPMGICEKKGSYYDNCVIDGVIISPPPRRGIGGGGGSTSPWYGDHNPGRGIDGGGGCSMYDMCKSDDGSGSGGGSQSPPPQNPPTDPCEKMKTMNSSAGYRSKIEELNRASVLNRTYETGYKENKNGTFENLTPSASTGHSDGLRININEDTKGYIHTHVNEYESERVDEYGNSEIRQPIKMFSPADVDALMTMAQMQTSGNYADLYGTMVSSDGIYTIKFTGTAEDIKTGFNTREWGNKMVEFWKRSRGSHELKFLKFLKDEMKINGVSLYKTKNNGTVQNKTLGNNNRIQSSDCP